MAMNQTINVQFPRSTVQTGPNANTNALIQEINFGSSLSDVELLNHTLSKTNITFFPHKLKALEQQ